MKTFKYCVIIFSLLVGIFIFVALDSQKSLAAIYRTGKDFIKSEKITFATGRPQKMRSLPNGDIVIEMEKTYFGEPDKPQDCIMEVYSPDLEHKKTMKENEFDVFRREG